MTVNVFDLTDTWNAGGTTFSAIKMVATDTASAAGSMLLDLRLASGAKFQVRKDGKISLAAGAFWAPSALGITILEAANTAAALAAIGASAQTLVITTDSSANHDLVLADALPGAYLNMTSGSANTVTVPLNATIAFPVGAQIPIECNGAGITTIVAAGGVTINCAHTLVARAQYSVMQLVKKATDTWTLFGDLA